MVSISFNLRPAGKTPSSLILTEILPTPIKELQAICTALAKKPTRIKSGSSIPPLATIAYTLGKGCRTRVVKEWTSGEAFVLNQ